MSICDRYLVLGCMRTGHTCGAYVRMTAPYVWGIHITRRPCGIAHPRMQAVALHPELTPLKAARRVDMAQSGLRLARNPLWVAGPTTRELKDIALGKKAWVRAPRLSTCMRHVNVPPQQGVC